jgi:hypothetical protein
MIPQSFVKKLVWSGVSYVPGIGERVQPSADVKNERGRIRTALRLNQDRNAEIDIKGKVGGSDERLRTSARWQVLNDRNLHLLGTQSVTWKIVKLTSWSMTTAALADSSFPVHWIKHPKVNAKAWLLVAAATVLPVVFALSLPRSKPIGISGPRPRRTFPAHNRTPGRIAGPNGISLTFFIFNRLSITATPSPTALSLKIRNGCGCLPLPHVTDIDERL